MRQLPFALVAFAAFVVVAQPLVAGDKDKQDKQVRANYYPLREGSKWYYRLDLHMPEQGPEMCIVEVAKLEKIDGVAMFRVEASKQGVVFATEHLTSTERGIFRHRANDKQANQAIRLLKYPVNAGDTWTDEIELEGMKMKVTAKVLKEEEVQVPAGKFKALQVDVKCVVSDIPFTTTYWFAANVGIVKQSAEVAGKKTTLELEKYELAK